MITHLSSAWTRSLGSSIDVFSPMLHGATAFFKFLATGPDVATFSEDFLFAAVAIADETLFRHMRPLIGLCRARVNQFIQDGLSLVGLRAEQWGAALQVGFVYI